MVEHHFLGDALPINDALGQAGLLIGRDRIIRLDPPSGGTMDLDDWKKARATLPEEAKNAVDQWGYQIAATFLTTKAVRVPAIGCREQSR